MKAIAKRDVATALTKGKEYEVVRVNYTVVGDDGVEIGFTDSFLEIEQKSFMQQLAEKQVNDLVDKTNYALWGKPASAESVNITEENIEEEVGRVFQSIGVGVTEEEKPLFMDAPTEEEEVYTEEPAVDFDLKLAPISPSNMGSDFSDDKSDEPAVEEQLEKVNTRWRFEYMMPEIGDAIVVYGFEFPDNRVWTMEDNGYDWSGFTWELQVE